MTFADTNVIIDLLDPRSRWLRWSASQVARSRGLVVNPVIVAECAPRFETLAMLEDAFRRLEIEILDLPLAAAFAAGTIFRAYRRAGTDRNRILADFLIGAHAKHIDAALLTRDTRFYRAYFPELTLITPDPDHG